MGGGRSIQLARVLGVRIGVDPSWFIVLFLVIWSLSGSFKNVYPGHDTKAFFLATLAALLFFASVVLHELGHAVVAMRNGIGIVGIDLWLFGGVAKMSGDTKTPGQEFRVAAAGPAVTALVAIASLAAAHLIGGNQYLHGVRLHATHYVSPAVAILSFLAFINVALLVLNLVPGFPLDGGRIARSIVWWRTGDRDRATRFAAAGLRTHPHPPRSRISSLADPKKVWRSCGSRRYPAAPPPSDAPRDRPSIVYLPFRRAILSLQ